MDQTSKNILWVDDDTHLLQPYIEYLQIKGYQVDACSELVQCEERIRHDDYDLLILDIMIPTSAQSMDHYDSMSTNGGYESGLIFFQRMKKKLIEKNIKTMVLTQRLVH